MNISSSTCLGLTLVLALASSLPADESTGLRVPPGFSVERVQGPPDLHFPMFATLDDQGRLYVTESSGNDLYAELTQQVRLCRVSLLEDRDGDGRYEHVHVFAENLAPSMGLAWRDGKLYAADPPDLVALEDTDGDGLADHRTVILTGFGHSDNGSLHGLRFGPDGWLYFTTGEPDGYRLKRRDGSFLEGKSGALFRSRPDGSEVEVVARGFENLVEIVFLPTGEIIGTDNWFQRPDNGFRDALVHLVEGGLYPYAPDAGTAQPVTGAPLPPLALYPAVALSGLECYHGRAFPPAMRGNVFSAQHNARKIVRHRLERNGSTFRSVDADFLWTDDPDFHPSDVLEDSDGTLLVIDTGSWYVHHCPTGRIRRSAAQGGIFRVRYTAKTESAEATAMKPGDVDALTTELRASARRQGQSDASRLVPLLHHPSLQVQLCAAEGLAGCGESNVVTALIERLSADNVDRFLEHALVHALYRLASTEQLIAALDHPSPRVQQGALVLLDHSPHRALTGDAIVKRAFVSDESLRRAAWASLRSHPEWVEQAATVIARMVASANLTPEQLDGLRGFVVAFNQESSIVTLVARIVNDENSTGDSLRTALLDAMSQASRDKLPAAWRDALAAALGSKSLAVRRQALQAINTLRLDGMKTELRAIARNPGVDIPLRIQALRALTRQHLPLDEESTAMLFSELARTNDAIRRLAAAEVLAAANLSSGQIAQFVTTVKGDAMISPALVLGALPREGLKDSDAGTLLDYLRAGVKTAWQVSDAQFAAVANAIPPDRRTELAGLREEIHRATGRQSDQLIALEPLLRGGNPERGRIVFEQKAGCANCHQTPGHGGILGPDLTKIGAIRSGRDLLESVLIPSATLAQGYESYTVRLSRGESLTGIRVWQPDGTFVLRETSGAETRITVGEATEVELQKASLMPDGLLSALTEAEIRDLFGYLQSLK